MFNQDRLFQQHLSGIVNRDLLDIILALTAKVLGRPTFWSELNLEASLRYHLYERDILNSEQPTGRLSLDDFRQACLLAFYEFHQHPGEKAWLRIGHLTRKAYHYGLHQIDSRSPSPIFDSTGLDDIRCEEWRYVWWCIFCLDSYSNITAAIPFVVQIESIRTSLITGPSLDGTSKEEIFLVDETESLWKTTKAVTAHNHHINFNIHIVTTAMLREAATLYRLWLQNPSDRLQARLAAFEYHLTTVRLALPPRYLEVTRNVLHNEAHTAHHARLICILHLHTAGLLICLPLHRKNSEEERLHLWYKALEYCQDMVLLVKQWDSQHSPGVDPAVCFIIYTALIVLHLHINSIAVSEDMLAVLRMQKDVLLLFLEQFSTFWYLPRFLISKQTQRLELHSEY